MSTIIAAVISACAAIIVCIISSSAQNKKIIAQNLLIISLTDDEEVLKTETAENIWQRELPYLKSVESSKDTMAKEYSAEKFFSDSEAAALLQSQFSGLKLTEGHIADQMQIFERTDAGYVSKIQIGNMVFSGRQVREALGLRSSNFSFSQKDDGVVFETKGYGHGAGMSQYGANYMAAEGRTYGEIIKHYYSGVEIKKYD